MCKLRIKHLDDIANAVLPQVDVSLLENYRLTDVQKKKDNTTEETGDTTNDKNIASDNIDKVTE